MKTFLIPLLCAACISSSIAQVTPNLKNLTGPAVNPNLRNVQVNMRNPLCDYKPSERVRYVFYDNVSVTEVHDRIIPQPEDYITIFAMIGGKQYTLVPSNGLGLEGTKGAAQDMHLAEVTSADATGVLPSAATLWRVNKYGNNLTLSFNGAYMHRDNVWGETGGTLGLQSGVVKVGNTGGIDNSWNLSTVNESGNNYLQLRNVAEPNFLGYCYREGADVVIGGTRQRLIGAITVKGLPAAGTAGGDLCNVKWLYKIYTINKAQGRSISPTNLDPNTYLIRSTISNKALMEFLGTAVFAPTNENLADMKWRFEITSRGTYFIINDKSGAAVGVDKATGKFIYTTLNNNDFYNTDAFQWMLYGPYGGRYTLLPFVDPRNPGTNALTGSQANACSITQHIAGSHLQEFQISVPNGALWGYVDMHTHPMSNFGFGGEFFFGACDGDIATALGNCNCMHNYLIPTSKGSCGQQNLIRNALIDKLDAHPKAAGYPDFSAWPKQSNTTHQQMWWEWINRARRAGLRSIVALAQNSHTLADGMETAGPYDDLRSMNTQIRELIAFVGRHTDIMDTVTTPLRMREVVSTGRLAVIIGIEMDNIGNFYSPSERRQGEVYTPNPTEAQVRQEIDRLYSLGVRYIFPIHIVNNVFGGAGVYGDDLEAMVFNLSNYYITGSTFQVDTVSTAATGIGFKFPDFSASIAPVKILLDILRNAPVMPLKPDVLDISRYSYHNPGAGFGHRNRLGLSEIGKFALRYMMSKGMMIDIDHMSERSVTDALREGVRFDYPLNSGHNGPRGSSGSEKARTNGQYDTLRVLGGMIGVGTGSAEASAFVKIYRTVLSRMGGRNVTIGTDVGVGAKLPQAPASAAGVLRSDLPGIEPCHTGNKTWTFMDYNSGGVSHYGMMPEFIRSIENAGLNATETNALFGSVEYFVQMWEKCERNKRNVH